MEMACETKVQVLGIALFGIGRAGTIQFGNLVRNHRAHLRYIVDLDTNKAAEWVSTYRLIDAKVLNPSESNQVFQDANVNGVVVCSPTGTHEEIVRNSLRHGKGVFCEKPISETTEGTEACYREADSTGKPLICGFNRRFDPSVREVRDRVQNGEVGQVYVIKSCARDHPLPHGNFLKVSGGMFHDCAIHDIDMVCWILQEYPTSVYVQAHCHSKEIAAMNDVDTIEILMKFQSGILANIDLSRHSTYGYDQRVEVLGSKGMIKSENQTPNGVVGCSSTGIVGACYKYSFPQRYEDSYKGAMNHFLDVLGGKPIEVFKHETMNASRVCSACEESHHTGLPVTLSWN